MLEISTQSQRLTQLFFNTTTMSTAGNQTAVPPEAQLPPNVSIYTGPSSTQLVGAKVFTRLATTAPDPAKLATALAGDDCATFCHLHQKSVLIFDEVLDTHHEHFRLVCLRLKEHGDMGVEYGRCVFDAENALQAGFQMDQLKGGAISTSSKLQRGLWLTLKWSLTCRILTMKIVPLMTWRKSLETSWARSKVCVRNDLLLKSGARSKRPILYHGLTYGPLRNNYDLSSWG